MQKSDPGKKTPQMLIQIIDDSKVPIAEEEGKYAQIKSKAKKGMSLTPEELMFLEKLVSKARAWDRAVKSSKETDPRDTMSG